LALIDSDATAAGALAVSMLIEAFAILILVKIARLTVNWRRHRRRQDATALASAA